MTSEPVDAADKVNVKGGVVVDVHVNDHVYVDVDVDVNVNPTVGVPSRASRMTMHRAASRLPMQRAAHRMTMLPPGAGSRER